MRIPLYFRRDQAVKSSQFQVARNQFLHPHTVATFRDYCGKFSVITHNDGDGDSSCVDPKGERDCGDALREEFFQEDRFFRKENLLAALSKMAPKAAALLDDGFDDITAVYALPEPYRKRLRTSNNIERLNEEIRRRERVIRIFPNEESMERIIASFLLEQHEKWISGKVYFSMQTYWDEKQSAKDLAENVRRAFLLGT